MSGEYVKTGAQILITPGADVSAGTVVAWGTGVAVIEADSVAGRPVGAAIDGVYEFAKASATVFALGAAVGYNTSTNTAVAVSGSNLYLGRVVAAVGNPSTHVQVKINAPLPSSLS